MAKYSRYYESDPNWKEYYEAHPEYAPITDPRQVLHLNIEGGREWQAQEQAEWISKHPLESFGYTVRNDTVPVRDGYAVPIKIYHPLKGLNKSVLPLLFVTHGGGWVQGNALTEEKWLLYPIFQRFEFTVISVEYRLAPEHVFPTYVNDCFDVFNNVVSRSQDFGFNPAKVLIAGSSAGGCSAAVLTQQAEGAGIPVHGAILNVPITCHPKYFPINKYEYTSYDQCFGSLLGATEMREIWDKVVPNVEDGKRPEASPLLGKLEGLPPHVIFVAGQDPLRDEAIAYTEALKEAGVKASLHIYQGVPHTFAEISELNMTKRFHQDLTAAIEKLLR